MGNTVESATVEKDSSDDEERVMSRQDNGNLWTVSKFYDEEEDEFLTEFEHVYKDPMSTICVERSIEALRHMRHPNIVKYLSSKSDPGKVYMLTECVVPAKFSLQKLSSVEAVVGIRDIGKALDFMLNRLKISHNNLHLGSVFVDERTHQWKLGGMEASNDLTKIDDKFLSSISAVRAASAVPPEEKDPTSFSGRIHPHTGDVWAFGQLILEVNEKLGEDDPLPTELVEYAETALTNEDPSMVDVPWYKAVLSPGDCMYLPSHWIHHRRPTIEDFLLHSSGRCGLTDVVDFLSDFVLKSEEDKKEFSKNMFSLVTSFPEEAVCHRLLPVLLTPPVMGDPSILPIWDTILIPKSGSDDDDSVSGFLSEDCYKQEILPEIIELLHSREKNIRTILLKKFEFYVNLFPLEDLKELVLPEIVVGIQEKDEDIVVATLRSLAFLVPLLGADVVIGTSRSTLFTDSLPASAVDIGSTESPPMEPAECKENPPGEPGEEDTIPVSDSSLEDDLEQLSIEDSPSTPYDQSISVKTSQS